MQRQTSGFVALQDIWSLGVMVYEAITKGPTFPAGLRAADLYAYAAGGRPYPWEAPVQEQNLLWRQSRLRAAVTPCLSRDPAQRPSAKEIIDAIVRMSSATTWAGDAPART